MNIIAAACFVAFTVAAVLAARTGGREAERRRASSAFIALALLLSFGAGLLQRDFYPFCPWPLVAGVLPDTVHSPRIAAVTDDGIEHDVDYRAWLPLAVDELHAWIDGRFGRLPERDKQDSAKWLLQHADSARRAAVAAGRAREPGILGVLSAPFFLQHKRLWNSASAIPHRPFVAIRFYRDRWNIVGRDGDRPVTHDLFYEFDTRTPRGTEWPAH